MISRRNLAALLIIFFTIFFLAVHIVTGYDTQNYAYILDDSALQYSLSYGSVLLSFLSFILQGLTPFEKIAFSQGLISVAIFFVFSRYCKPLFALILCLNPSFVVLMSSLKQGLATTFLFLSFYFFAKQCSASYLAFCKYTNLRIPLLALSIGLGILGIVSYPQLLLPVSVSALFYSIPFIYRFLLIPVIRIRLLLLVIIFALICSLSIAYLPYASVLLLRYIYNPSDSQMATGQFRNILYLIIFALLATVSAPRLLQPCQRYIYQSHLPLIMSGSVFALASLLSPFLKIEFSRLAESALGFSLLCASYLGGLDSVKTANILTLKVILVLASALSVFYFFFSQAAPFSIVPLMAE